LKSGRLLNFGADLAPSHENLGADMSLASRQLLAELRKQWPLAFPVNDQDVRPRTIAPDRSTATLVAEALHRRDLNDCKREHYDVNAHLACLSSLQSNLERDGYVAEIDCMYVIICRSHRLFIVFAGGLAISKS
jgi:hypothetical protein